MKQSTSPLALEALFEAKRQGFAYLTPDEHRLIDLLRRTSYTGRQRIYAMARTLRRSHPWTA